MSGGKEGLTKIPPQNRATHGAHPWASLLPGHSGGPCCGHTCPTPSAGTRSHVYTRATGPGARTHGLPCGRRGHGRACLSGVGVGSNNAPGG